jgi:hypothetical protein
MKNVIVKSMVLVLIISLLGAQPALAYIDPSTGGMLFQILAVAFASLSAILLIFSRQIRTFVARFRRLLRGSGVEEEEGAGVEPPPPPHLED